MRPIGCPEMSVRNYYYYKLRTIPEGGTLIYIAGEDSNEVTLV